MKPLLLLSVVLSSLTLLQGCATDGAAARDPSSSACHDASTNSEDHHLNHCNNDMTNQRSDENVRGNP